MHIDLNSDVGESFGAYRLGADADVMRSITSANVACGFHAGDPDVMRETVRLAREAGVAVGAHPGFADLAGFGRREMRASPREVEDMVLYQIGALDGDCARRGRQALAREGARCPLQHGGARPHAGRRDRAGRPRVRSRARAVRSSGVRARARGRGRGPSRWLRKDSLIAPMSPTVRSPPRGTSGSVIHDPEDGRPPRDARW